MARGTARRDGSASPIQTEGLIALRRAEIIEVASSIFARKGYYGATTRDIGDELGMSVGTIFNYFTSKEELLQAVLEVPQQEMVAAVAELEKAPPTQDTLVRMLVELIRTVDRHRRYVNLVYQDLKVIQGAARDAIFDRETRIARALARAFAGAAEETGAALTMPAALAAHNAIVQAHAWAFRHWAFTQFGSVDEYIELQVPALLRSVGQAGDVEWERYR
jgi:AcrR family transcriptional regulator